MSTKNVSVKVGDMVHYHLGWSPIPVEYDLGKYDHAVMIDPKEERCTETNLGLCVDDISQGWETTESMILQGYEAVALDPDEQDRWDNERAVYKDCWGE